MHTFSEQDKTDEEVGNPDATVDLEEKNPSDKEPTNESIFGNNQFLVGKLRSFAT